MLVFVYAYPFVRVYVRFAWAYVCVFVVPVVFSSSCVFHFSFYAHMYVHMYLCMYLYVCMSLFMHTQMYAYIIYPYVACLYASAMHMLCI